MEGDVLDDDLEANVAPGDDTGLLKVVPLRPAVGDGDDADPYREGKVLLLYGSIIGIE